ncbi:MAG: sigma 54-interacting transcriptional regulator [Deltaproteobacteria bacterium]|nr:sigma 54-interacting transcriptional regulator [Deltaproteobacteria bacterium]
MTPRILVIDDEEKLRFTFKRFLVNDGYDVTTAVNYDEAVARLKESSFHVIFTDIILGGKSGIDLLRTVMDHGHNCPVVMITGAPDIETASEALRLGAYDYISKPVLRDTLLRVAKMALKQKMLVDEKEKYRMNLEAIFRSVDDGIISVDMDMNVTEVNSAFYEVCGTLPKDIIGKSIDDLTFPCKKNCLHVIQETIAKREALELRRLECSHGKRQGKVVTVKTSPLADEQGNFSGAVMVVRDETRLAMLERDLNERRHFHNMIGGSRKMQRVFSLIEDLSDVDTTVLILGESGTGKELVARALHEKGERMGKPFVSVNCSALSEDLLESELFGHVRGAFTGAVKDKVGRFEKANGGTLFLDEIGDISSRMQLRLLRVLQEREFERVGESAAIKVDVRVVAATNRDLRDKVKKGEFREDLYYRLKVVELMLPPLRERREDIPLLIDHFLKKFNEKFGKEVEDLSDEANRTLLNFSWHGNIRELEHVIEHAFILCRSTTITLDHLPPELQQLEQPEGLKGLAREGDERQLIIEMLEKNNWNKAKAARALGVSRITMYRKIEKYNIVSHSLDDNV